MLTAFRLGGAKQTDMEGLRINIMPGGVCYKKKDGVQI